MKAVILINPYYDNVSYRHQCSRLKAELEKLGVSVEVRRNILTATIADNKIISEIGDADFCVYLDKDCYASEMLEKTGMRLFNRHSAIRACDDKMTTAIKLSGQGIRLPKTLPAPMCYAEDARLDEQYLNMIEAELGYPLVVKSSFGSLGAGVARAIPSVVS